jgi:hypothetical protein
VQAEIEVAAQAAQARLEEGDVVAGARERTLSDARGWVNPTPWTLGFRV